MSPTVWVYAVYLVTSVALTIWVARTLHRNGRLFLVDAFHGNEALADSVNHLLVVGFYLVNGGFVALFLKTTLRPEGAEQAMEVLSAKIGVVLLVLGVMHFFNLLVFSKVRRAAINGRPPTLPVRERNAMVQ